MRKGPGAPRCGGSPAPSFLTGLAGGVPPPKRFPAGYLDGYLDGVSGAAPAAAESIGIGIDGGMSAGFVLPPRAAVT